MALNAGFIFGGDTKETPQSLAKKRALIASIMANQGAPRNIGEGLNALGDGIVANVLGRRADKAEQAGQESASAAFAPLLTGFGASAASSGVAGEMAATSPATSATASTAAPVDLSGDKQAFIQTLLPAAMQESQRTGVDPRIIVAQAAQETGWGKSAPGNNFFGIKSHGKGGGQSFATHEYIDGKRVNVTDSFRQFGSPEESVRGYGDFILENPRYKPLREAKGLDGQLAALQASGYATDPNYSRSVGSIARNIPMPSSATAFVGNQPTSTDAVNAMASMQPGTSSGSDYNSPMMVYDDKGARVERPYVDPMVSAQPAAPPLPAPTDVGPAPAVFDAGRFGPQNVDVQKGPRLPAMPMGDAEAGMGAAPQQPMIPDAFTRNSPQLANADPKRGILRALLGIPGREEGLTGEFPAAPAPMPQGSAMPPAQMPQGGAPQAMPPQQAPQQGNFPPPPQAPSQSGPSMQQLIAAVNNPWLSDSQKAIAQTMLEQKTQEQDPMRQLQIQKLRKEVEGSGAGEVKIAGDRALLISPDGTVKDVTPSIDGGNQPAGFRYSGNSVEAQALNGLIDSGQITPDQAQQLGAGKTITGPNGEIIFMTPQGVFGQPAQGGSPQPVTPGAAQQPQTNIPITEPRVTLDEKKAMTFADRMVTSGDLIDQFGNAGTDKMQVTLGQMPFGIGNMLVGDEFQKFDQARRDFINAQLRRESGAVISDEEFDNANKQYFPQPGDGADVLRQKAANRRVAIDGMVRDGGPTYKRPQGQKPISEMTDEELEALANGD